METIIENIKDINYFELFSLKQDLDPDLEDLELKYFQLQAKFHPDKFINSSDSEKRISLYYTSLINDAYSTLKATEKRFEYLLSIKGFKFDEKNFQIEDKEFLIQQMEIREEFEDAMNNNKAERCKQIKDNISKNKDSLISDFKKSFINGSLDKSFDILKKIKFYSSIKF